MAVFSYKALDSRGRPTKGVIDAESARMARQKLKLQGIFPTSIDEATAKQSAPTAGSFLTSSPRARKVDAQTLCIATRQLATLVGAGMPLVEALRALGDQIENVNLKGVVAEVGDQVNEGSTLAQSLRQHPKVFPKLYANMVASGEASGSLEVVLTRLADLMEAQTALRRKVGSALVYPALMLLLCFGVIVLLLTYVVPQITQIFASKNAVLPLPTRVVIGASDILKQYYLVLVLGIVGFVVWFQRYKTSVKGRRRIDRLLLRLPLVGELTLKVATSRFAKNLGTMLASGIELLNALGIAKNIVGNVVLEDAVESATEGVREGSSLAAELEKTKVFPKMLIHMIAIGEKTGQLEDMLLRAANSYESEIGAVIASFTAVLEPILILFLAVIVGSILAAVMLPMLEMTSLAGA
ncbi:MAG: type II secretion system inner membrane protein GspF [Bdellovibrionota bacterium]